MASYPHAFAPLPSDDEALILNHNLQSLPAGITSNGDGYFDEHGYHPGTTGSLTITGLTNQVNLQNGGFISLWIETAAICKDDSLDSPDVTQSSGVVRLANSVLLSLWGAGGNGSRIQLYHHTNGQFTLYSFAGPQTVLQPGITSVGKEDKTHIVLSFHGNFIVLWVNGSPIQIARITTYDTDQFTTIYLGANGAFGANHFGNYAISDIQISLRPLSICHFHEDITIWGDSFVEAGFGTNGGTATYGIREYDAAMLHVVQSLFIRNHNTQLKISGHGYSGYSWSDSNANPQTDNQAAIAQQNPSILIMPNSINGIQLTSSLVSDYQASLEGHIDYVVANCSNLRAIGFTSMMPFTQNPGNTADRTSGVVEASNVVMAGLVDYVQTNYPSIRTAYRDIFNNSGGHDYPSSWTYGVVDGSGTDPHPSPLGHFNIAHEFSALIQALL